MEIIGVHAHNVCKRLAPYLLPAYRQYQDKYNTTGHLYRGMSHVTNTRILTCQYSVDKNGLLQAFSPAKPLLANLKACQCTVDIHRNLKPNQYPSHKFKIFLEVCGQSTTIWLQLMINFQPHFKRFQFWMEIVNIYWHCWTLYFIAFISSTLYLRFPSIQIR